MKKYIKSNSSDFDTIYDDKFGEPTTQVFDFNDLIDYLDEAAHFANTSKYIEINSSTDVNDSNNQSDESEKHVNKVVATDMFEKSIKKLTKKHKGKVILEIKDTIVKLKNFKISSGKHNHPLKNSDGHQDIHLDGGKLILLYKYISSDILVIDLKLQDVVNHDKLKRYDTKNYTKPIHEFDENKI